MNVRNRRIFAGFILVSLASCAVTTVDIQQINTGKKLAFDRKKGNCLACHVISDGEAPGNIAGPLNALASRYPNKAVLKTLIWDATRFNPDTSMPPFGRNKILTDNELDLVVDYLWTLE